MEDWHYPLKAVMIACGATGSGESEYKMWVNWYGRKGK